MEEQKNTVIEKVIGGTVYIVEYASGTSAKETVRDKVRRLILDSAAREIKKTA